MTSFVKTLAVVGVIALSFASVQTASAGMSIYDACVSGALTPHGVWDCR